MSPVLHSCVFLESLLTCYSAVSNKPCNFSKLQKKISHFLSFSIDCEVENHESTAPYIIYGSLKSSQESRKLSVSA